MKRLLNRKLLCKHTIQILLHVPHCKHQMVQRPNTRRWQGRLTRRRWQGRLNERDYARASCTCAFDIFTVRLRKCLTPHCMDKALSLAQARDDQMSREG